MKLTKVSLLVCFFSSKMFALTLIPHQLELSIEGGVAKTSTKNTSIQVTPIERDDLKTKDNKFNDSIFAAGIHYRIPLNINPDWFPYIKPGLNVRYVGQNLHGRVYQFQDPEFYNYNYKAPFSSTRLMLDVNLGLISYKDITAYLLGGVGETWNTLSYYDYSINQTSTGTLVLNSRRNTRFVSEAGAGLSYDLNKNILISLEYLFANLGTNSPSFNGILDGSPVHLMPPIHFSITSQSIQFVVNWKI